jgi:excisionase family DNA binding protein
MLKTQRVIGRYSSICSIGIYFALNNGKIKKNGGNSMYLMEKDEVFTTEEAIQYLKISKPTFLKYIRLGRIKAIKAGKGWRVLHSELNRFLKGEVSQ